MKNILPAILVLYCLSSQSQERLLFHEIKTDAKSQVAPWFSLEPSESYDHIIGLVWNFWDTMRRDMNGIPYYMNHQVWRESANDGRGIGGDQLQMAMSSWQLLYMYSGNERVKENMKFMADYYLANGLSPSNAQWPNLPFPYNTLVYSGKYDGDMVLGKDYTQPDKAGSLGIELIGLYKMMSNERYPNATEKRYLDAAINIANTLASKIIEGDENNSPWPFKVNAYTGETGILKNPKGNMRSSYTTNWSGTAELFSALIKLKQGNIESYRNAFNTILNWMKKYPMKNNKWGPFFEDVPGWSDTQINAMTWARFIMNHRDLFPNWKADVQSIFDWVYKTLGNDQWKKYGVTVINEQTSYQTPGNSHTARQAADELLFSSLTGNEERKHHAILQLNWATYMVKEDGRNRFPNDDIWLTDGYGDYIRHYLRAMSVAPELSPAKDHILFSTSVVQQASYKKNIYEFTFPVIDKDIDRTILFYTTYDDSGREYIRLTKKPSRIFLEKEELIESPGNASGYNWTPMKKGGLLTIRREKGSRVTVLE